MVVIERDKLKTRVESGETLRDIAKDLEVTPGYISKLCKQYEIETNGPGRPRGTLLDEETKRKIAETLRKRAQYG